MWDVTRNKADAVSGGANLEQERDIKYIAGIRSSRCSGLSLNACDSVVKEQLSKDGKQAATFLGTALTAGAGGLLVQAVGGGTKAAAVGAGLGVASNGAAQYAYNRDSNKGFFENISNLDKTDFPTTLPWRRQMKRLVDYLVVFLFYFSILYFPILLTVICLGVTSHT